MIKAYNINFYTLIISHSIHIISLNNPCTIIYFTHNLFFFSPQTRLLVTHGIHWLPKVDNIVVMVGGVISETGTYDELLTVNGEFAQFLKQHLTPAADSDEDDDESK